MKVQNVQNALQFLPPILANSQMMQAPGMTELIHDYVDLNGLSKHILDKIQNADSQEEVELAREQEMKFAKGLNVAGIPGESDDHKMIHMQALLEDVSTMQNPSTNPQVAQRLQMAIQNRAQHLQIDNSPKEIAEQTALGLAQPPQSPQMGMGQPPQGQPPQGQPPQGQPNMGGGMPDPSMMPPQQQIGQQMPGNPQMAQAGMS